MQFSKEGVVTPSFRLKYKYEIWTHKYKWQNLKLEVVEV